METDSLTMDPEESAMRDLGQETDAAQHRPVAETPPETPPERPVEPVEEPQPETPPQPPPESPEPVEKEAPEDQRLQRDPVTGKFQKSGKPETDYSKAVKEKERQDRSWSKLQAEKEQFRLAQTQWEEQQRVAQLEAARQNYQPLRKDGLTAKEYYDGAVIFERDGDHENALKAYKVASEMGRADYERHIQMQEVEAEYQWRMGMQEATKAFPDLWKPDNPQLGHLRRIVQQHHQWLYKVPGGFKLATEVADLLVKADTIKELEDEIVELRAYKEQHQRKSQPGKSGYAAPRTGEKEFDEMSLDEMEAHLKHTTAEADSYR